MKAEFQHQIVRPQIRKFWVFRNDFGTQNEFGPYPQRATDFLDCPEGKLLDGTWRISIKVFDKRKDLLEKTRLLIGLPESTQMLGLEIDFVIHFNRINRLQTLPVNR